MKVAIVGSRNFEALWRVRDYVMELPPGDIVVSGGARGVDATAAQAAHDSGHEVIEFLPDWKKLGKRAGFERNVDIVDAADRVVAFWDGQSRGTRHSMNLAKAAGKPLEVILLRKLFLDDERTPFDNTWHVVRTYNAFVLYIERNGVPDIISFDHDLAFEHYPFNEQNPQAATIPYDSYTTKTGYHAVKWLEETGRLAELREAYVHSMNPVGRMNIMRVLKSARIERLAFVGWQGNKPVLLLLPPTMVR